jgi:hypothetical protein
VLLVCFRLAKDLGMTVADLTQRMSWAELLCWIAYYTREADMAVPPEKRPVRPKTKEEAAQALDRLLGGRAKIAKPEPSPCPSPPISSP